jgi:anthranilate synthase component 1
MRPVAGTYSKGQSLEDIRARAKKLIEDPKEQAEHIMLIDHCRNDLGKISQIGTVSVSDLFTVESYQNIHHIVSEVSSITLNNVTPLQALKEAFPIATLTGTPKIRAMEIINELENHSRGSFGGAVLAISADGSIDSCVTIRSALITKDNATIKVGAGIVADSKAELEYEECLLKAYPMLVALNNAKINHNSTDDDFSNR